MKPLKSSVADAEALAAANQLAALISEQHPDAAFELGTGEDDPAALHLIVTAPSADADEILDLVMDDLLRIQVDRGIPLFVIPAQPPDAALAQARSGVGPGAAAGSPLHTRHTA